ncbi:MAG: redoxin domain-containing protein [Pseudomonadota bacterium]
MLIASLLALALAQELGPEVGTTIPEVDRFAAVMGDDGATIVFVRSVDWCPFCKAQVVSLDEAADEFEREGRPLVFVSYDSQATQAAFAEAEELESVFIADEGSEMIEAFGLLNEQYAPGSRVYGVPHPAIFIVDEDGTIDAKLYEDDYTTNRASYRNRPATEIVLKAVEAAD